MPDTNIPILRGALIGALLASAALSAGQSLPAVKGLYLDRDHNPAANGTRFDIELERPDGNRVEVPVTYEFHSGDRIWLRLEVRTDVYVYVLNRTLTGHDKGIAVLRDEDLQQQQPAPAEPPRLVLGPEKLNGGAARLAPQSGAMQFDDAPGIEKLYVILSSKPLQLAGAFDGDGRMIDNDSIQNLDREMAEWHGNADFAVPDKNGIKGVYRDNYGYALGKMPGEPMMLELTVLHSR